MILKLWVLLRALFSRLLNNVDDIEKEIDFLKPFSKLDYGYLTNVLKKRYIKDKLFWFIPWDWVFGPIKFFLRGGGDCSSLNYVIMLSMIAHGTRKDDLYFITYTAKPFKLSHSTIIKVVDNLFEVWDYGRYCGRYMSVKSAIQKCGTIYGCKVVDYVAQDYKQDIIFIGSMK